MSGRACSTGGGVDFTRLYADLEVDPRLGLAAFKQAYRRRVAELHPDRPGRRPRDPDALIALNLGYAAVLDFHREHGRLPGAPPTDRAGNRGTAAPRRPSPEAIPATEAPLPGRIGRMHALMLPALVVAALWFWLADRNQPAVMAATARPPAGIGAPPATHAQLGMDRATVARILGPPLVRDDADVHWVYGASWVHFECDQLANWYSSPLQPLQVASPSPPAGARTRGKACPQPPHSPVHATVPQGGD